MPPQTRLIIGIAGIPASGKSTLAQLVVDRTNTILKTNAESIERTEAIVVGLDGWHLTRAQLATLPDPQLAKDRRGAHWTFDPDSYLEFVKNLRVPLPPSRSHSGLVVEPIIAPSFDHAIKDPDPAGVKVDPWHRIVVIEGLYCFLSVGAWKEAGEMLDERWLVAVDFEKATERIVDRHVASGVAGSVEVPFFCSCTPSGLLMDGVGSTMEGKRERHAQYVRISDMIASAESLRKTDGRFLLDNSLEPTRILESVQDPAFFSPSYTNRTSVGTSITIE